MLRLQSMILLMIPSGAGHGITNTTGSTTTRDLTTGLGFDSTTTAGHLLYNGSTSEALTYHFAGPRLDLSDVSDNLLRLTFTSIANNFSGVVSLMSGIGSSNIRTLAPTNFVAGTNVYDIDLTTGTDSGSFMLNDINTLGINFNSANTASTVFNLDTIEAVPEPISMISIEAGLTAFVKNRRRKLSKK